MTGSAKPPPPGTVIVRDPLYGYESGGIPTATFVPVHDRELLHWGEWEATLAGIDEISPEFPGGMTVWDALAQLEQYVTRLEGARPPVMGFSLDALIFGTVLRTFALNAWIGHQYRLDAIVRRVQASSFPLDAIKNVPRSGSFLLDAVRRVPRSGSFTLDAVIA